MWSKTTERHMAKSWFIKNPIEGGLGLKRKIVQSGKMFETIGTYTTYFWVLIILSIQIVDTINYIYKYY
jgi:hypothetical protein